MNCDKLTLIALNDFIEDGKSQAKKDEKGFTNLLNDLKAKESSPMREKIIEKLRKGLYSDFMSSCGTPIFLLISDLQNAGFHDLAQNATCGTYDHGFVVTKT